MVNDNEKVYDEQIAPLMHRVIAICEEHGLPVVAEFEYAPDHFCTTTVVPPEAAPRMRNVAALLGGSVNKCGILGFGGTRAPRGDGGTQ